MACLLQRLFKILWRISSLLLASGSIKQTSQRQLLICLFILMMALLSGFVSATPSKGVAKDRSASLDPLNIHSAEWVSIFNKKALICQLQQLDSCLTSLPIHLQQQAALSSQAIRLAMGFKNAMVLSVSHATIAGVIVIQPEREPVNQSGLLGVTTYAIGLKDQARLSLWHEIGHLHNINLQADTLPAQLSAYQHEWLADVYLLWRIAQEGVGLEFAWQQLHRRNLAVIQDSENLSHWSSPQLQFLLQRFDSKALQEYSDYAHFIADVYPLLPNYTSREIAEYSSLIQRTFGSGVVQPLPNYMYWRHSSLALVLSPTLTKLMGESAAQNWLSQHLPAFDSL
ncbi:hypothetical protein [Shewanella aestuarii]|uniref:Uncharacterized protein n=1 Tax=Shewanella aestuarii TaxID=1028752 RepID=A0A6G9QH01_9GAMM|nr:hypothetical protein [Shewanella aestuarii]QIR13668.1 hypothetical protein HBH39_03400 [Shewanella aestuarii]